MDLNIVRPDYETRQRMADALNLANEKGLGFRICTGEDEKGKWVKWDNGSGWTPPFHGIII